MNAALLVAAREFAENARTKGFWISILLVPVLLAAAFEIQMQLQLRGTPTRAYALVDPSGELGPIVERAVDAKYKRQVARALMPFVLSMQLGQAPTDAPKPELPRREFVRVALPADVDAADPSALRAGITPYLLGEKKIELDGEAKKLFAMAVLPAELARKQAVDYWCANLADTELRELIERGLERELRRRAYLEKGLDDQDVQRIAKLGVPVHAKDPSKKPGEEEVSDLDTLRQWAPVGFVYILFIGIFTVSQMLLNSTIEEKSNRIVEVLFSSITAWELMIGKLLGIAGIGVTMLVAWLTSAYGVAVSLGGLEHEQVSFVLRLIYSPEMIVPFALYFVLGFLLYAGAFLAIGSLCNTIKESQNFMAPVMVVSMVPLFTMMFIPKDPNGTLATVLSWIPPWTPFVMMNRVAASPPLLDVVGTFVLLVASVVVTIWLSGRVFRTAILRTGQPPRLFELLRWMRG